MCTYYAPNYFLHLYVFYTQTPTSLKEMKPEKKKKTLGVPLGNEAFSGVEKNRANSWDKFSFYWKCLLLGRGKEWKKGKDNLWLSVQNLPGPDSRLHFLSPSSSEMETGLGTVRAHLSSLELPWWIWRHQHKKNPNRAWTWTRRGVGTCQGWTQCSGFSSPVRMW